MRHFSSAQVGGEGGFSSASTAGCIFLVVLSELFMFLFGASTPNSSLTPIWRLVKLSIVVMNKRRSFDFYPMSREEWLAFAPLSLYLSLSLSRSPHARRA